MIPCQYILVNCHLEDEESNTYQPYPLSVEKMVLCPEHWRLVDSLVRQSIADYCSITKDEKSKYAPALDAFMNTCKPEPHLQGFDLGMSHYVTLRVNSLIEELIQRGEARIEQTPVQQDFHFSFSVDKVLPEQTPDGFVHMNSRAIFGGILLH